MGAERYIRDAKHWYQYCGLNWRGAESGGASSVDAVKKRNQRAQKQECTDPSPDVFIFPNARKRNGAKKHGFIRTGNYPSGVLKKLAEELKLPKR